MIMDGNNNSNVLVHVVGTAKLNMYNCYLTGAGSNNGEHMILSSIPQGILSQETLVEYIFTLMFSPSCPYVVDPTGQL
jgi:hypothetical protein